MPIYALGDEVPGHRFRRLRPPRCGHHRPGGDRFAVERVAEQRCSGATTTESRSGNGPRSRTARSSTSAATIWRPSSGTTASSGTTSISKVVVIENRALIGSSSVVLHKVIVRTGAVVSQPGAVVAPRHGGPVRGDGALGVPAKVRLGAATRDYVSQSVNGYCRERRPLPKRAPSNRLGRWSSEAIPRGVWQGRPAGGSEQWRSTVSQTGSMHI